MVERVVVTEVRYAYPGAVQAVRGVTLTLAPTELQVVLGPNGSGKSTLLALMAGLYHPATGTVVAGGTDVARMPPRVRARAIALVPQTLERIPAVRVLDFVLGGRYAHLGPWRAATPGDHAVARRALDTADATPWADRLLTELSGGERQRVMIARALAQESDVLLLDEPTASLDPEHQLRIMRLVRDLANAGRAIAVVTHDLNLASQFADRVVLLHDGAVAAEGPPAEVLREPVLAPVYGDELWFGTFPDGAPLVLPWDSQPGN